MNVNYWLSLFMWLVRLYILTYFVSCIMYAHVIHACGIESYSYFTYVYGFKIILNILVLNKSWEREMLIQAQITLKMEMI